MIDPWFGAWSFGLSKDSKKKEAAWVFIQWMTSKDVQDARHRIRRRAVAALDLQVETLAKYQPWWPPVYEFMLKETNPDERMRIPEWAEISDIMGEEGNKVWIGEIDSETAAANMEKRMTEAMRRAATTFPAATTCPAELA